MTACNECKGSTCHRECNMNSIGEQILHAGRSRSAFRNVPAAHVVLHNTITPPSTPSCRPGTTRCAPCH